MTVPCEHSDLFLAVTMALMWASGFLCAAYFIRKKKR